MGNFSVKRAVNMAAFGLGLLACRRPVTRRAYNAAADAVAHRMKKLLGKDNKYYREGGVREDIVRAISEMPDLKTAVLKQTPAQDQDVFVKTGYIRPEIARMIAKGPDLNLKTAILFRMSLRECYQRFCDWNKRLGAKKAITFSLRWTYYKMHEKIDAEYGMYQGTYKGLLYANEIRRVRNQVWLLSQLPPRHKATKEFLEPFLMNVRLAVETFELNLILGNRSIVEWYDEFHSNPSKYCRGCLPTPQALIDENPEFFKLVDTFFGVEAAEPDGILTRMIPKVVVQKVAHISENEAKEKWFKPLNEYFRFLQWLPAPKRASCEEMEYAFLWALAPDNDYIYGGKVASDMGITMLEYANAGLEKIREASGQVIK